MKVLQINAVYNLSSTGRTTTELHHALLNNGIESYVAYSKTNKPDDENLYHIGSPFDCKVHAFLSRLTGKQGYYSRIPTLKLIRYMKRIKPDIVHLRNLHGNYINIPMLLKYLAKNDIATVVTLHDFFLITGKCVHFLTCECNKWQTQCDKCPNLQSGNPTWFFDRTKTLFNDKLRLFSSINKLAFVGVSDWVADEAAKSPIIKNASLVKRIYNWIDFNSFHKKNVDNIRREKGLIDKFVILGVSSSWAEQKGLDKFLKLSKRIGPDEIILMIGNMPDDVSLPENIISVKRTDSVDELVDYYNCADVFLTFSLEETFGKVSAEALSCGTPVVCFNSTANPELVGDRCGTVVEKNDFEGIIKAIEEIKNNGKSYYSDYCIDYTHKSFDKNKCIDEYIELYRELVNGKESQ